MLAGGRETPGTIKGRRIVMEITPAGTIIKGYKATDENMCCRGFKFELRKWYEHDGDLVLCQSGFHFCEYQSGPLAYYPDGRIFECEAEYVLKGVSPGADVKHVAKRIRLVSECSENAGNRNTGYGNTGNRNVGSWNAGYENVGNQNTGNQNAGNGNTGDGNVGNYHAGSLNMNPEPLYIFDEIVELSRESVDWEKISDLAAKMSSDDEFDVTCFLDIPNATPDKIKRLHQAHIEARRVRP